jgi:hypothetical protein
MRVRYRGTRYGDRSFGSFGSVVQNFNSSSGTVGGRDRYRLDRILIRNDRLPTLKLEEKKGITSLNIAQGNHLVSSIQIHLSL